MTEISAIAPAADAGTGTQANIAAANPGSPAAPAVADPFSGLQNAESREWIASKGYKELDAVVSDARFADKLKTEVADLKTKALAPPAPDAKPEEWDAFYARLGRPEKADGYEFALPEGLPEGLPYDAERATQYKQWSHQAGLAPKQAQIIHDLAAKAAVEDFNKSVAAKAEKASASTVSLEQAWGAKGSDKFVQNVQLADRFIANNGGQALMAELKSNGLISEEGFVLSPLLARAMAKAGTAYKEAPLVPGSPVPAPSDPASTLYPTDPFKRG